MDLKFSFVDLLNRTLIPILVSILTYFFVSKRGELIERKKYSRLGSAIVKSLIEEVRNGVTFFSKIDELEEQELTKMQVNPPRKSWSGMQTIPDDVLLRIIEVSRKVKSDAFPPSEIRIHCKNYFDHMLPNIDNCYKRPDSVTCLKNFVVRGKYLEAAQGVLKMLEQTESLLDRNSKRLFPK